jgi:hypothetical protein
MAQKVVIQQYDRGIKLFFNITIDNISEPIDGATVLFKMKNRTTGLEIIRECEITDAELGECMFEFTEEDTAEVGNYLTEVQIEYENGVRLSVDNPVVLSITEQRIGIRGRCIR